ncbi:unnamed protein product [Amaranthus hypochondriacus]
MASNSTELSKTHQIRSLSLPSKLNPINQRIETELKRLRIKEESSNSTSERITIGVHGLAQLYRCINQALSLPLTQQALSLHKHKKHIGALLKTSSRLLNICSSIKEVVLLQESVTKVLESSIFDSKENCDIACYNVSRKEVIRRAKDAILALNQLNAKILGDEDSNSHLQTMIKSVRCINIINLSVIESILVFLSMPVSKGKRSLISKLVNKGDQKIGNEINDVDNVLHDLILRKALSHDRLCFSLAKLKALLDVMKDIANGLENMCRELSETKVCLMNIMSS